MIHLLNKWKIYYKYSKFDKFAISFGISPDNLLECKYLVILKNRNILKIKIVKIEKIIK